MTEKDAKEAFALAEKELKEKQIQEVKETVKKILLGIDDCDENIGKWVEKKKYLKMDLEDLKAGRLDKIEERQKLDPKARDYAVIIIIKEKEVVREVPYWYWPYQVYYGPQWPIYGTIGTITSGSTNTVTTAGQLYAANTGTISINNSIAKDYTSGTYVLDTKTINLR
jgi:hypothetical protein